MKDYILLLIFLTIFVIIYIYLDYDKIEAFTTHGQKIGIVSMMKNPKNIETWLERHRNIGIERFYIRLEDTPDLVKYLESQPDVVLDISKSNGLNEYTEKQNRQGVMVDKALAKARDDGIDWLIHIDADEIVSGDLSEITNLPETTRTFWMQNIEALYSHVPTKDDNCFVAKKFHNCANESCAAYANGKSGGRTTPDVSSFGCHRMRSSLKHDDAPKVNLFVEHYESCDFEQYKEKYIGLSKEDTDNNIPFPYYNESISAAKKNDDQALVDVYKKYRVTLEQFGVRMK
jgi:hypothetical protein